MPPGLSAGGAGKCSLGRQAVAISREGAPAGKLPDHGHSVEAEVTQGKGSVGRSVGLVQGVQGWTLGPEEQGQAPAPSLPCRVAWGKAGGSCNPQFSSSLNIRIASEHVWEGTRPDWKSSVEATARAHSRRSGEQLRGVGVGSG